MFALLEKVNAATDPPVKHVRAAREAGLTDDEMRDALHVQFVFNVVNRLANALGYGWAAEADRLAGIRVLHRLGYRLPGFLLR